MYTAILAGLKRGFKETYTQWAYLFVRSVWTLIVAIIFYKIWTPVVQNPEHVLAYIAVAEAFYFTSKGNVAWRLEQEYNQGVLDVRLLRPVPLWLQYLSESFGPGFFGYLLATAFLGIVLYAYAGIVLNPITIILAYPLYAMAKNFLYFTIGAFVVNLGRTHLLRWVITKFDLITILVPSEIIGSIAYAIIPNAYAYYWPGQFAITGNLPPFWWIGTSVLFMGAIWGERHIRHRIEVFGG